MDCYVGGVGGEEGGSDGEEGVVECWEGWGGYDFDGCGGEGESARDNGKKKKRVGELVGYVVIL